MLPAQSMGRCVWWLWRLIRQRRRFALVASLSLVAVVTAWTLGARSQTPTVHPQPTYMAQAGATLVTPTPSPTASATPPGSHGACPPVAGHEEADVEAWLLNAVNQARANAGVAALASDPRIHAEALSHSAAMTCFGMSHYVPPGTTPETRMRAAGVTFTWGGENIGWSGRGTSMDKIQWLFNMMMAEQPPNDGHRKNILQSHFTGTGIGIYVENSSGRLWLTEDFAG